MFIKENNMPKDRYWKFLAVSLFAAYLAVGLSIYKDYGVHVDEYQHQRFGRSWGDYIANVLVTQKITVPPREMVAPDAAVGKAVPHSLIHGPFWQVVLYFAEKVFYGEKADPRDVIFHR